MAKRRVAARCAETRIPTSNPPDRAPSWGGANGYDKHMVRVSPAELTSSLTGGSVSGEPRRRFRRPRKRPQASPRAVASLEHRSRRRGGSPESHIPRGALRWPAAAVALADHSVGITLDDSLNQQQGPETKCLSFTRPPAVCPPSSGPGGSRR
ncbi:hypothetical protein BS50DRAFT_73471 [Corynespora cassiicola Philippines]|uniref:Uncharacterized protein n=1 Tax=Corynespora cassiicola Philippines TaxID=1448308 RepID=A0A2T2NGC2_CORCC|nr:hypothetical protein BS50DRAFT_73471 [Corynespora cassiicola Philippines]